MPTNFLRLPAVEAATGMKKATIYNYIKQKKFPAPIQLSARCSVWPEDEIVRWQESKRQAPRALAE
jgi:prophage regulatory protein